MNILTVTDATEQTSTERNSTRPRRDTSSMNILTVNDHNAQNSRKTTRKVRRNLKENGTSATYDVPKRASLPRRS